MAALRRYLYRDDVQISEYLEQIQDGALGERTVERASQKSKGGRAGVKGVVEASGGSESTTSESYNLAPTPVSRAAQLEDWLGEAVAPLGPMDHVAFEQIEAGEFVRFEGSLEVPEIIRTVYVGAALGKLADVAKALGQSLDGADEVLGQVEAIQQLLRLDGFPIVAKERSGGATVMFVARPELIVGEPLKLHGERVAVLGRIKRTIPVGQTLEQNEMLPNLSQHLPAQNREQRRAGGSGSKLIRVAGPAVVIEPIAIYS